MILTLAPETTVSAAKKAWQSLGKTTGRDHTHLINASEHTAIVSRHRGTTTQNRYFANLVWWKGRLCYTAGYTNVHELILGAHCQVVNNSIKIKQWMRDFGVEFVFIALL